MKSLAAAACCLGLLMAACAETAPVPPAPDAAIAPPPAALRLDPFYTKYLDAGGIPITTSPRVPDAALLAARDIVETMLSKRPDIRRQLIRMGARVGVMATNEYTTDLPEQRDWKKPKLDDQRLTGCDKTAYDKIAAQSDRDYWNSRARGMGGTYTTGATENLLGYPGSVYYGENILVHEFGHNILAAIRQADPKLYARVEAAYAHAKAQGLWSGSYALTTVQEYWAEGAQFWFDDNFAYKRLPSLTIVSHDDLKAYDPALYAVLAEVFPASHHIASDVYWNNPYRMASIAIPEDGREVCG
jgi:hypothetical protein